MYPAKPSFDKNSGDNKVKIQKSVMQAFDALKKQELLRAVSAK
ncbi:hypothetical protein J40TS1_13380 [Paenibacillus montaniterrae]|uniref:Uncharacterized protein n=1 Tax=Paenibacillus montaniterrae TaxID=429341 RepID=A0A920CW87_9BACL|nr:hypothetical protein [Paenibacillus montaniterrae]GIP15696.1 hypothetical protein J40TS1_13380 [Paenibacillus montaniterrae]